MPRAGELRERIVIERARLETTESGQAKHVFEKVARGWAKIEKLTSGQRYFGAQVVGVATHRITTRWLDNVDHTCRVQAPDFNGGRTFNVEAADPDRRAGSLTLEVVEVRGGKEPL